MSQRISPIGAPLGGRSLRYAYMDHWRVDTPQGPLSQYSSVERFDAFLKQIAGVGYEAIETFDFHLPVLRDLFGSLEAARAHMQSRGIDRVLSLFHAVMYDARQSTPHVRATHDRMAGYAEYIMKSSAGLGVQNFIVMPAGLYFDVEPVTDDKIRACAELWNRIGQMTLEGYGVKTCCHHEFFCGIRTAEQLKKFYDWTDPRYVFLCLDTAQHVIAGVDPVDLFIQRRDRVAGFHLKDTHHVDVNGDYRRKPDAEVMAPTTDRWFWEMGTEGGLVDFPALYGAMKDTGWAGWVGVEHDKADVGGGNYPESTAIAAWYLRNVLSPAGSSQGTESPPGGQERSDLGAGASPSMTERQQARWGYAINQWKAGFTGFARLEQHERALKVTSACGFDAIELSAGTGRWDPMGRPENIGINFGSVDHFKLRLREWGIRRVASLFLDPLQMSFEELHHGLDCSDRSQHALLLEQAGVFARFLAEVGGDCLVLRALPPYGRHGGLDAERQAAAADCWNAVGQMTAALGVKTVLHLDALSALRGIDEVEAWLKLLDPATVGLALDTAELTIAGHDVTAWYRRFQDRVWHIHVKDALAVDSDGEYRAANAERALLLAGGQRGVQRWFGELGSGLVDWTAFMTALRETGYAGWLIVESDKGPAPQAAAMMQNAWTVRHVLQPLLS